MTTLQAKVTKTAAFNGTGVDISGLVANSVARVKVDKLTAGKVAIFALQDSADNFGSDIRTLATFPVKGEIQAIAPREREFHHFDMLGVRFATASSKLRLILAYIDSAASVDYEGLIQP